MKQRFLILLVAFLALMPSEAWAKTYSAKFSNASAEEVVKTLKQETGMEFVYSKDLLKYAKQPVTCDYSNLTLDQLLNRVLSIKMSLGYEVVDNRVLIKAPNLNVDYIKGAVSGTVYDKETGEPLPGATVVIEGTIKASATDIDGHFTINNVDALNPVASVFYVGMKPASVKVTKQNQEKIEFNLEPNATIMSEVVVTGYADVSREKMTGAATTISSDKLDDRYSLNLLDNLEGRVAGLSTYGGELLIRGTGTFSAGTSPLLVVDGLPIEGSINDLNPQDIKSVNVLKDAAAAAIYGARAANGIIVVTTKNAKTKGKIDVDFSADMTWYENKNVDYNDNFLMNAEQHVKTASEYYKWYFFEKNDDILVDQINNPEIWKMYYLINSTSGASDIDLVQDAWYQYSIGQISESQLNTTLDKLSKNNFARDYANALYRRRMIQQYNLALRSSSDKSDNNIVVNFKHDNSGIINHKYDWLNVQYKGIFRLSKWLEANVLINSLYENQREYGYDYQISDNPFMYSPYQPFYNEDGSVHTQYPWYSGNARMSLQEGIADMGVNLIDEMYDNTRTTKRQNTRYHGSLLFKIVDGLTANAQFVYETGYSNSQVYANEQSHAARTLKNAYAYINSEGKVDYYTPRNGGFLQTTVSNTNSWTARGQINYQNTFGKHDISAIAGLEFRETMSKGTKALSLGYDEQLQTSSTHTVDLGMLNQIRNSPYLWQGSMAGAFPASQFAGCYINSSMLGIVPETRHRYASGYANATYTYDSKYNIFGSFRKDYADVFGLNSKFRGKPLWSIGVGWNIHSESFMHDLTWINFLKLRASYGVTGNIYQGATSIMTASSGSTNSHTGLPVGTISSPANPDLRWEQNRTFNVGIDFNLLNYRLRGSLDIYLKDGRDIFNGMNLESTTGFSSIVANVASIRNKGVELSIGYDWFRANSRTDFQWSTNLTFSYNKNEVIEVENAAKSAYALISRPFKPGYPVSTVWSYRFAKISDEPGQRGMQLYYGDNDVLLTTPSSQSPDILEYSGQREPKIIMGLDNNISWYGFQLGFVMAYYGGHVMRAVPLAQTFGVGEGTTLASYFLNAWTPENPTNVPGVGKYSSSSLGYCYDYDNQSVHDASFLKIRNVTFSYTFPDKWIKPIGINGLALRFQVNDLPCIWKANKVGVDPETLGIRKQSSYTIGLNFNI